MSRAVAPRDLATLGRRMAAAQGITEARSEGEWTAYGQACHDALGRNRPVPALLPATPPPAPPPSFWSEPIGTTASPLPPPRAVVGGASRPAAVVVMPAPSRTGRGASRGAATVAPRPPLCAHCGGSVAPDVDEPASRVGGWMVRAAWALVWRYTVLGSVLVYAGAHAGAPWLVIAAVAVAGLVLGLWHRRWVLARAWRAVAIAGVAVYLAPLFPSLYPQMLVGSLGALTVPPLLATFRRTPR